VRYAIGKACGCHKVLSGPSAREIKVYIRALKPARLCIHIAVLDGDLRAKCLKAFHVKIDRTSALCRRPPGIGTFA